MYPHGWLLGWFPSPWAGHPSSAPQKRRTPWDSQASVYTPRPGPLLQKPGVPQKRWLRYWSTWLSQPEEYPLVVWQLWKITIFRFSEVNFRTIAGPLGQGYPTMIVTGRNPNLKKATGTLSCGISTSIPLFAKVIQQSHLHYGAHIIPKLFSMKDMKIICPQILPSHLLHWVNAFPLGSDFHQRIHGSQPSQGFHQRGALPAVGQTSNPMGIQREVRPKRCVIAQASGKGRQGSSMWMDGWRFANMQVCRYVHMFVSTYARMHVRTRPYACAHAGTHA